MPSFLLNKNWRLNNLYKITNKEDKLITLNLNYAQKQHFNITHPKTITLKSRQQGVSTYKVAENLDKCIFNHNAQTGIQSYGLVEGKKLYKKALLAWDNFDPDIKELLNLKLVSANSEGLTFNNNSSLRIGNFRGDTVSSLHVSELAKIAAKFPDKAEELNTGAFEAVSTNSAISIESTAEGQTGLFYEIWQTAMQRVTRLLNISESEFIVNQNRYAQQLHSLLTPLDFYPIFLSWVTDPDCNMPQFYQASTKDIDYFNIVEEHLNITLTQSQKNWASAKRARLGEKFSQEYPYSPEDAFAQKREGTIFPQEYEQILTEKRLYTPKHLDTSAPTYIAYDIGVNDTTVLTFAQIHQNRPHIVLTLEDSGKPLSHYVELMRKTNLNIRLVYLPHDANVQEFISGRTRIEEFRRLGVPCQLLPRLTHEDYISALRGFIPHIVIDPERAKLTLNAIQNYRWQFNKQLQVYMNTPLHDQASNPMDSLKYLAIGIHYNKTNLKPYTPPQQKQQIDMWAPENRQHSQTYSSGYAV